jgi:hypothetical protein
LSRPRVFQSSGIFPCSSRLVKEGSEVNPASESSNLEKKRENLGQRLKRYATSIVISKNTSKGFFPVQIINIKQNFNQFFYNTYQLLGNYLKYENPTKFFIPQNYLTYITN